MAKIIKLKRSAVPGKIPSTTDLDLGEMALNTNDGKLFIKKDDGVESIVEIGEGNLKSDGSIPMDTGYTPSNNLDLATKEYVDSQTISSIDDIGDVDTSTTAPTPGQALLWDNVSGNWVPGTVANAINRSIEKIIGDGSSASFTLTNTYTVGSETLVDVYRNGLMKIEGASEDYVLSSGDTLTFNTVPNNGDVIIVKILS